MRILFMGTPDFAVPCLQSLIDAGHAICAVFTQPDKPKGRGYTLTPPPVKVLAEKYEIPVFQPKTLKTEEVVEQIKELSPEVIVVVAYGKILPKGILGIPPMGCINVHASLLPKYRGAAPIQWAVIHGEKVSGVTTMYMAEGLDTVSYTHLSTGLLFFTRLIASTYLVGFSSTKYLYSKLILGFLRNNSISFNISPAD